MWPRFEQSQARFLELEGLLSQGDVIADRARYTRLAKEHAALAKMVKPYREYLKVADDIAQAETLLQSPDTDAEMRALVEDELKTLRPQRNALHSRLEDLLLGEGEDYGSIIVEIRAGTGGDEAALFAGDLYDMYTHYARDKGWRVEDIAFSHGEQGGFKEIVFGISGDKVFQHLRYESGGHRVQRVPKTETQGRIHTSMATVAIMPEPDEVQVDVKDQEIEWERMRAAAPAASTSTRPSPRCASGTSAARRRRWRSSARTSAASTRTSSVRCVSCARDSMSASSKSCTAPEPSSAAR